MALIGTLTDTFPAALAAQWTAAGGGTANKQLYVNCSQNAGAAVFSNVQATAATWTWSGSALALYDVVMPAGAGADTANAQFWMLDPAPAATVDRLGFEYRAAANALDLIGQTGAGYAPIGITTTLTYDPVAHRCLRIEHLGTSIVWSTSPDGLTWTAQRTLATVPTWANKATLRPSFEAFRTTGTNDTVRIGAVNVAPAAVATTAPTGVDALQRRELAAVRGWKQWLVANSARGFVGEFNGVTLATKYGDATQGAQWDALLDTYLVELEVSALDSTVWAAGREWGEGYPLGVHVGTNVGDPLTIANAGSAGIVADHPSRGGRWRGVNLSGYETGVTINGGGTVRTAAPRVHSAADFGFLASSGVDMVRLPAVVERLQPTPGGALATAALADLNAMFLAGRQVGIRFLVDPLHNYGRRTNANGSVDTIGGNWTNAQLADFWTKFVTWVNADATRSGCVIGYDLMNEPHNLPGGAASWESASQAALTAIRNAGDNRLVVVEGYTFASLTEWTTWHPDGWITDPAGNFAYSAHHYWDTTSAFGSRSGTYQKTTSGPILPYADELAAAAAAESVGPADEAEDAPAVTASGLVTLAVADEAEDTAAVTVVWVATLTVTDDADETPQLWYPTLLPVAEEADEAAPPTVGTGTPGQSFRKAYVPGFRSSAGMRVMVQRIRPTLQWLDLEVPLGDLSITKSLSRPQAITGTLSPHLPRIAELALRPWNTYFHVEDEAGLIRASGILAAPFGVEDDRRAVECVGVSTLPHQTVYEGAYAQYQVDPMVVIRHIWAHVQSFPDANLGVTLSQNTSPVRVGGYPPAEATELTGPRVDDQASATDVKPYELNWWDQTNCGEEIRQLCDNVPLDYVEREAWNAALTAVDHTVVLGYPRAGTRRTDLRFAQGENIIGAVPIAELDDAYVTDVRMTGAGEGSAMVLGQASRRGTQIRRVVQLNEKAIRSTARAKQIADAELLRRAEPRGVDTLLIDATHENAPYGSFMEGDDIFVQCEVDWVGEIAMWHRILEHTYTPGEGAVALKLAPSSTFRYGASA